MGQFIAFSQVSRTLPAQKTTTGRQAEKGREARKMPETHKFMPLSALGLPPQTSAEFRGIRGKTHVDRPVFLGSFLSLSALLRGFFPQKASCENAFPRNCAEFARNSAESRGIPAEFGPGTLSRRPNLPHIPSNTALVKIWRAFRKKNGKRAARLGKTQKVTRGAGCPNDTVATDFFLSEKRKGELGQSTAPPGKGLSRRCSYANTCVA